MRNDYRRLIGDSKGGKQAEAECHERNRRDHRGGDNAQVWQHADEPMTTSPVGGPPDAERVAVNEASSG
ncbi:MAG: hypothetical protein JO084_11680 [Bradyrhizobiaceae bacterium]|nr:hypothetical protein [Hyphomicrobiales bacterium]MBV9428375.1 hypothetical protein [Bradyrhizobiaceae bacterium]